MSLLTRRRAAATCLVLLAAAPAVGAHAGTPRPLVAAWATAPKDPGTLAALVPFHDDAGKRTIRNVVRVTLDGSAVRIRLSNLLGTRPLRIDDARLAHSAGGAKTSGAATRLRFGGRTHVTIPVGSQALSDVVTFPVRAGQDLAVSLFSAGPTGTATTSGSQFHTNWISAPGDAAGSASATRFGQAVKSWYFLSGVDVRPLRSPAGAVVAIGASITTGFNSTLDAHKGWVDLLARRLHAARATRDTAVVNTGIAGNNLHEDTGCYGQSLLHRLQRDALAQPGVRTVIVALGSNDLTHPRQDPSDPCIAHTLISADGMIADYELAVRRIQARHLRAVLVTIPPFGRNKQWSAEIEQERLAINAWMRTSPLPDGVIDAEPVLADPGNPSWLRPAYDSGDGLHPNDAGHAALAKTFPLDRFTR